MDQAHIHLIITHLAVFGSLIGAFVLIQGIRTKSHHTVEAAYYVFIISAIGGCIAYLTGEGAEESVEHIQGVAESIIEQHEEFAVFAFSGLLLLGIVSFLGLFAEYKKRAFARQLSIIIFILSLCCFVLAARTAYLGGQIRHTEINDATVSGAGWETEDDD